MAKKILSSSEYTFNAAAKTVTFNASLTGIELANVELITNLSNNTIIYQFNKAGSGGTLAGLVLTLDYDTTSMLNTDLLQIFIEGDIVDNIVSIAGTVPVSVAGTVPVSASSLPLPTGAASEAKQDSLIAYVDGIEALLSTIDSDTSDISSKLDVLTGSVDAGKSQVDVVSLPKDGQNTMANSIPVTIASDQTALYTLGGSLSVQTIKANYAAAQTDTAILSASPGQRILVTRCTAVTAHSCTVDVSVTIGFGLSTTPTTSGVVLSHPGIAPGSGIREGVGAGILGVGADAEDLRITCSVPTGGSIDVVITYIII